MARFARRNWYWGALLAVLAAGVAYAEVESYRELKSAPGNIITNASGADSTVATTVIADRIRGSNSNPTAAVSVAFSGSAADTCVVSCLLFQGGTFIGLSTATAIAGAYTNAAGDNIAPLLYFDLGGADTYEIRHAAPSAGTADLRWWAYAASAQQ